jgi:predicted RNA-binding Zn ribbon-like protein
MTLSPEPDVSLPKPEFRYVSGDAALDLVNTVDWTDHGLIHDRLNGYAELTRWAEGARVIEPATARRLRALASRHPRDAAKALQSALQLRDAIQRVVRALTDSSGSVRRESQALERLNAVLSESLGRLHLAGDATGVSLAWRGFGSELDSPVWAVAWSAARLLASPEARQLRVCAGDDCGWVYVDRSRNGLRRWCEMATCGTRQKSIRRRKGRRGGRGAAKAS